MTGHYLMFDRNCAQALKTYADAFGGEILEMMKYGDMPPNSGFPVPDSDADLVLHARILIDGEKIMCADSTRGVSGGDNMYVTISSYDEALIMKAWDALKQGGTVFMELAPSFFAKLHGSLRDAFGINWMFTYYGDEEK